MRKATVFIGLGITSSLVVGCMPSATTPSHVRLETRQMAMHKVVKTPLKHFLSMKGMAIGKTDDGVTLRKFPYPK